MTRRMSRLKIVAAMVTVLGLSACGQALPVPKSSVAAPAVAEVAVTPVAKVAVTPMTQDVAVEATALPDDDIEAKVAKIHAAEKEAAAVQAKIIASPAAVSEVAATPGSKAPAARVPSAPRRKPKAKPSTGSFTGTGRIVNYLIEDRPKFVNSYHNGDRCSDGFHYMVDIYDSSEVLVAVGSMQFGVVKNLQKHSGSVEFTCTYPFTFKLSGASSTYIFDAHEVAYMTPANYGTQAFKTAALRAGSGPSFQDVSD
jgi:hypothetical protein